MKVKDAQFFTVVSSFLNVYLVKNRSCSSNTVKSYEDALNLLFTFLEGTKDIPRQRVSWSHFTRQNIQEFVDWLEKVRNCSRQTQLQRLAAIRSFVRYGGIVDLRVIAIQADVERIRYRKPPPALVGYLTKEELSIFLAQPNCKKRTGFRNMVFLVLMYDTAARCQEMLDLRIQDLVLHRTSPCVYFTGKGNKTRVVPILPKTAEHLRSYLKKFHPAENRKRDDYVFYAYGGPQRPMSPDTVAAFVKKYGESARHVCTSIPERVHPHMLRHTRAMHLYQDGVPLAMVGMDVNLYLLLALLATLLVIAYLLTRLHRVRGQLSLIKDALMDIKSGNLNRRVLVRESDMTKQICYDINEIAMSSQSRLIQQKQSEQAYKRLMTSLSHDVKTPLASLVGYLEAVESKMVTGAEQEEYIRVAAEKAHHLKEFVTVLFEWVKLDAGEQIFHFELCDLNELSRNIMADWVPLLESHDLTYEIEIPETEYMTRVDSTAYTRILNNLLQNILTHSVASQVSLTVTETEQQAKIVVADNGKGISASDLPHIFERMYQCDHSRAAKGNGLGLSIAKELVSVHKGTITAASIPGAGTTFTIMLPKAL